jgi:hypothetical protein
MVIGFLATPVICTLCVTMFSENIVTYKVQAAGWGPSARMTDPQNYLDHRGDI